jgi:hypothetical protein
VVNVVSPEYVAVIGSAPSGNVDVVHVAENVVPVTWVSATVAHPTMGVAEPLAKNETAPPPSVGVTVAVKVTDCPKVDGLGLEASVVVVAVNGEPATRPTPLNRRFEQSAVNPPATVAKQPEYALSAMTSNSAFAAGTNPPSSTGVAVPATVARTDEIDPNNVADAM